MAQPVAALIVRVAADLAELKTGVGEINSTLGGVAGAAQKLGGALAAAFSFQQLASAAGKVTSLAGHIDDLARKAGISAEAVQELDFAAKQNGLTFDTISVALALMSNKLVEGDKSAVASLTAMGVSVAQLRAMTPDQAFQAIGDAIAKIPDPMERSKVAMDLFGKSGATLLPVLIGNIGALREEAVASGAVISNELIAKGDQLGDTWEKVNTRLTNLMAQALLPLLDVFTSLPGPLQTLIAAGLGLAPMLTGIATSVALLLPALGIALPAALATVGTLLLPAGLLLAGIAAVVIAWKKWDVIVEFLSGFASAVKEFLVGEFGRAVEWLGQKVEAVIGFFRDMYNAVVGHSYVPAMVTEIGTEIARLEGVLVAPAVAATAKVASAFGALKASVGSSVRELAKSIAVTMAIPDMPMGDRTAMSVRLQQIEEYYKQFPGARANGTGATGLNPGDASGWSRLLAMQVEYEQLKKALQGRAMGGPVSAGSPYMVGERGPELFVPHASGSIVPHGAGATVINHIYVNGTAADVARKIMDEITKRTKQSRLLPAM